MSDGGLMRSEQAWSALASANGLAPGRAGLNRLTCISFVVWASDGYGALLLHILAGTGNQACL